MPGRYTPQKRVNVSSLKTPAPTAQDEANEGEGDFWRFVGDVAPVAGTVLGGVGGGIIGSLGAPATLGTSILGGAAAGATLGGGIGQGVGALARSHGDSLEADRVDTEQTQQDRKAALLQALLAARR